MAVLHEKVSETENSCEGKNHWLRMAVEDLSFPSFLNGLFTS